MPGYRHLVMFPRTRAIPDSTAQHWGAAGAGLGLALLVLGLVLAQATPALAHDQLRSEVPQDGSQLSEPPREVSLDFGVTVNVQLATVVVRDAAGSDRSVGRARARAGQVVQPLTGAGSPGTWRVDFRVVSSDGHPITGSYAFTVMQGAPTTAAPSAATAPPVPAPTDPDVATSPETLAAPAPALSASSGRSGPSDTSGTVSPLVLGLGVVSAAAVFAWRVRARRRPPA